MTPGVFAAVATRLRHELGTLSKVHLPAHLPRAGSLGSSFTDSSTAQEASPAALIALQVYTPAFSGITSLKISWYLSPFLRITRRRESWCITQQIFWFKKIFWHSPGHHQYFRERETETETDRQTDRRETNKQTDRQTDAERVCIEYYSKTKQTHTECAQSIIQCTQSIIQRLSATYRHGQIGLSTCFRLVLFVPVTRQSVQNIFVLAIKPSATHPHQKKKKKKTERDTWFKSTYCCCHPTWTQGAKAMLR